MSSNPERVNENEQAAAAATAAVEQVEGEIRAFVRRDVSAFRRSHRATCSIGAPTTSSPWALGVGLWRL